MMKYVIKHAIFTPNQLCIYEDLESKNQIWYFMLKYRSFPCTKTYFHLCILKCQVTYGALAVFMRLNRNTGILKTRK